MRSLGKMAALVVLVGLLASPALAQRPPMGGGFGVGPGMLLQNKSVQEELKLTEEQTKKAGEALKKVTEDTKELAAKLADRNLPMEERAEILKKIGDASMTALKDNLKPEQLTRLKQVQKQVQMQFTGVAVFADPEVQAALKITDEQKADLKTLGEEVTKEVRALFTGGGFDQESFKKVQALQKEGVEKASKLLTAEQKKVWDDLIGKAFEFKMELPMRPPQ